MSRELICPVCGDDWDLDMLHEEVAERRSEGARASFTVVLHEFQQKGCGVALRALECGLACRPATDPATIELAEVARTFYELLGDDIDGAINEIEDYRLMTGH